MVELNPVRLWRHLLALPNESRAKTVAIAFLVSVTCAVLVTAATVILRPIQAQNRAMERQAELEALLAEIPGLSSLLAESEEAALSTVVVDLRRGAAAPDVTHETLAAALTDPANWTDLTPQQDLANIRRRANLKQTYLVRGPDGRIELVILPISGTGYGGPIEAMLALQGDANTVAGLAVVSHAETPGLGARITEQAWRGQFAGMPLADQTGAVRLSVARGPATSEFEVDGITGATRTNNAMASMLAFWLGPDGYGPLLAAIRRGEF